MNCFRKDKKYNDEQLKNIEKLAEELTPASEISALLDLPWLLVDINTPNNTARLAYLHGMAKTAHELRIKNLELARAMAPSAMDQCFSDLKRMNRELEDS